MADRRKTVTAAAAPVDPPPIVGRAASPNTITASARVLPAPSRRSLSEPADWQAEAWGYYDTVGEARFASSWFANALSRVRLSLAYRGQAGSEPVLLDEDDPRNDEIERLAGGETGQSQLLASFAPHLIGPGICYLVGLEDPMRGEHWQVFSREEIRVRSGAYQVLTGPDRWTPLPGDALPVEVWRPHPRRHFEPDSPMRPLLPVLRELSLLTQHVEASATSRLAGAGILVIPSEATFPVSDKNKDSAFPLLEELMDAMITPIGDRAAASAVVPFLVQLPGEYAGFVNHIEFSTGFDERTEALRNEAIRRFASGMDMPAEVLLGLGDSNHWTAWQIEESAVKLHVVPMLETICQALTIGWWRPMVEAGRMTGQEVADGDELIVWYDLAGLVVRPDRSADAMNLYDRDELGGDGLREALGYGDDDKPKLEDVVRMKLVRALEANPTLAPMILPALGVDLELGPMPAPAVVTEPAVGPDEPDTAVPATGPPPAPEEAPAGPDAALLAAADVLVWRALERAGNRLRNRGRSQGLDLDQIPPTEIHLAVDPSCLADLEHLLDGAWDPVAGIASRHGLDPEHLTLALDRYTRAVLAAQIQHTYDGLAASL